MSQPEKIPLLSERSEREPNNEYYLLLSIPESRDKSFIQRLNTLGNCSGTIVAAIATLIVIVLVIMGIAYHADVSELTTAHSGSKRASPPHYIFVNQASPTRNKEIETPLGRLKGYIQSSRKGRDYVSFYKVPYAKPPVGELRFKDPQLVERWEGVRDIQEVAPSCIQKSKDNTSTATGEEDCLYSNIYVPYYAGNDTRKLPVMVYIHGGGFDQGNGSRYGAAYFMDEDVVLITFQYRLGLFGFLNTGDREATGNMGLKDQVMFLKWAKNYISYFNGDETLITIFGNSMGGFSVSFHMISPMSSGLFHRAISQSGTVLTESTNILDLQPEVTKKAAAEAFNCSLESSAALLACLRGIDAADMALLDSPDIKYALTVEHGFDANNLSDVFMPDKPYELLKSGKVNRVPYMMGVVMTEWIVKSVAALKNVDLINDINANFTKFTSLLLGIDATEEESQAIKSFYFKDKLISNETERNLTNLISDRVHVHGTKVTADFHSLASDTYLYYFSKRPGKSYCDKLLVNFPNLEKSGTVSHADEIQFQFPYYGYPQYPVTDTEYFPFSELLVKLWTQFGATGKPIIEGRLTDWNAFNNINNQNSGKSTPWYELNDHTGVTTALQERMDFWDQQFSHKKLMYEQ